jgi:putative transposase
VQNHFQSHVVQFYWKPYFWHHAYFVGSVGVVSLETIRYYIEKQGTQEKAVR